MKKAIVLGGSGFVGSHVADALFEKGFHTTIFDQKKPLSACEGYDFIEGSILDFNAVKNAIKGKHYVYHLAGQADIQEGINNPSVTIQSNVIGTTNVLEACRHSSVERFVFASTVYVYSDSGGFYRASKQACEILIEEYQKNFEIPYTILRYGSLYGPRAGENNSIHSLLKQAIVRRKICSMHGQLEDKRDYIHVHDAARMSVDILDESYVNSHVMLTGYQTISRQDLIAMICEMLGGNIDIQQNNSDADIHALGHYKITPYVFKPRLSRKLVSSEYIDLGQGLLECIREIYNDHVQAKN